MLIPMPEQVRAGKKRPNDTNARFSLVFSIQMRGVTDERILQVKYPNEQSAKDEARLEFAMHGNLASRKEDGSLKWDFSKVWGNVSAGMCNKPFYQFVLGILEKDAWVQKFCTRQPKDDAVAVSAPARRVRASASRAVAS